MHNRNENHIAFRGLPKIHDRSPSHSLSSEAGGSSSCDPGRGTALGRRGAPPSLSWQERDHLWKPLLHEIAAGSMDIHAHQLRLPRAGALAPLTYLLRRVGERRQSAPAEIAVRAIVDERGVEVIPRRTLGYDTL